jgi:hypothetical protein
MKRRHMKGIPGTNVSYGDVDASPFAPLHRRLGIRTFVRRQAILTDINETYHGRRPLWHFDPVMRVGPSNHLYRESVTLAAI